MQTHTIPFLKNKTIKLSIAALLMTAASLFIVLHEQSIFNRIMGGIGVLFFGFVLFYIVKTLFDKKPGLVIDATGITDNASAVAAGFIPWEAINRISLSKAFITIETLDTTAFTEEKPGIKQFAQKANITLVGSPINIPD